MNNQTATLDSKQTIFLNVSELAQLVKVKPRTVYDWVARKERTKIPVERAGGQLRFRLDRVLKWTEEGGAI